MPFSQSCATVLGFTGDVMPVVDGLFCVNDALQKLSLTTTQIVVFHFFGKARFLRISVKEAFVVIQGRAALT